MIVPRLRSPIVLVHGLLGYDHIRFCGWTVCSYFPGIPEFLSAAGNRVFIAKLSPTQGVPQRAAQLKAFLSRTVPDEPVHLFSHSMGGLDSRYMISRLDMGNRVLSLTTIGTPHRGSAFADWGTHRLGRLFLPMFRFFDIPPQAFYDLTTATCQRFNAQVPDAPGVRYLSVAGKWERHWPNPWWRLPHHIVSRAEGANDGVVSVASASYGESTEVWDADHVSMVNWPNPSAQARGLRQDRITPYGGLVRRLADEGF
jgi:triacylglycerol lipase